MIREPIDSWIEKATQDHMRGVEGDSMEDVQVVARQHRPAQGITIVDLAEKIRPALLRMFTGVRDENGMLIQPARIRGISLNLAQRLLKEHYN